MKEIPDSVGDPFANYTPVKVAHPVVDVDAPELAVPSPKRRRRRGRRRRWLGKTWRALRCLAFWLCVATAVTLIGIIAYGGIYNRPVTDEIPALAVCAREANALSGWGQTLRARFAKAIGPQRGARRRTNGGSPVTVVSETIERAGNMGAERQKRMLEAQQFADGTETRTE